MTDTPAGGHPDDPNVAVPEDNRLENDQPVPAEDDEAIKERKDVDDDIKDEPRVKVVG